MTATYLEDFETLARNGGSRAPWLQDLRRAALERFRAVGFPTTREEDWRFNNLAPITTTPFRLAPAEVSGVAPEALAPFLYTIPGSSRLVFVNGRYAPALSALGPLPDGVRLRNLSGAFASDGDLLTRHLGQYARIDRNGFTALNTAFVRDGALLYVPAGVELPGPIHVVFVTDRRADGAVTYPRNFYFLEPGARAAVIESYVSLGEFVAFTNAVTEAVVQAQAQLTHLKIQRESEQAYHVGTTHFQQGRESQVHSHSVSLGAAICRNNLDLVLDGPGIESQLLGLYMGRGTQEVDNHTFILHAHPHCATREVYKGILEGASHGVFNGKVYVTPQAQKTDAKQTNRNLLLSDRARVDTKPQLEIFADDVKCTHGATVGSLDQQAAFYLKTRGVGGPLARKILTYAFAAEVLEEIPWEPVRTGLEQEVRGRLEEGGA
ncbi:MAG TPA: Fe-S cluster assembly protein SufD [Gemmatimonadales bacterium]|nr:Fe-S cluster assembly protein SufD [Gemmatimonadales bacterium]